ncbi:TauD/TfdA family dioxygenase [Dactylosporangium sp. AC04546]|uniref:TauD/TfdA family dioxygenase n=1 Tax=Dactylosporangium sp. AC04546 TaxID=2862460 RepID=UPI001EE07128|nr:TauD/TfdA family dioxygenase [Dactylosporangium sp. AC04546]WVK86179.1 TauD/TfdA family dioxygenase [Dactylosporangium sp. AC04546]
MTFSDGHRGQLGEPPAHGDGRTEAAKTLWDSVGVPRWWWRDYLDDPVPAMRAVWELGFCLLSGTPVQPGAVLAVARSFGHVRTTNYGDLFDVRVTERPNNLAFTGLAIGPHTDNPYRDPVPTIQLLHCLRNSADGGESGLLDGFRAAALLREAHPEYFRILTTTPVTFAWSDGTTRLRAEKPIIGLDPAGRIREVRYNHRSLRPPANEAFYAAYRAFDDVLNRAGATVTFRLDPGDCVIFDNTRLMHSRTAFTTASERHLQGCYADLDALQTFLEESS